MASPVKNRFISLAVAALVGVLIGFKLANRNAYLETPKNVVFVRDEMPYVVNIYRSTKEARDQNGREIHRNDRISPATAERTFSNKSRKIFIDAGANVANTVTLFRETYPDGKDYIIHSFDIDERLNPFFGYYAGKNHVLHCPVGVADKNDNATAYSEAAWYPGKQTLGMDVQWGGGALFVDDEEKQATQGGGRRRLSHRRTIPTVDLSMWIQNNTRKDDYVILKLDVEGAEYAVLRKMLQDGTFDWIDKFYGEYHDWEPTGDSKLQKYFIRREVTKAGFDVIECRLRLELTQILHRQCKQVSRQYPRSGRQASEKLQTTGSQVHGNYSD
ncbi:uncharacterized protein [Ptychodera flava]|uniref:uncharacterized protein n=1 Tax=Ptychodera flava TaxID=63121 RepID=UPI003969D71A